MFAMNDLFFFASARMQPSVRTDSRGEGGRGEGREVRPHGRPCPCGRIFASARTLECIRVDASVLSLGNFITDAMHPSHGRPSGHRPSVRPSVIVRVTTLVQANRVLIQKPRKKILVHIQSRNWIVLFCSTYNEVSFHLSKKRKRK
jgi:hypothetical protein